MKNFEDAPFLVIWELTQACDLACMHCRACAIADRNPFELTTDEGSQLLETIRPGVSLAGSIRRRVRGGLRVSIRFVEDRAVRHQDHRSAALQALCGTAAQGRTPLRRYTAGECWGDPQTGRNQ